MMTVPFHFMFHIKGSIYQGKVYFFTVTITQLLSFPQSKIREKNTAYHYHLQNSYVCLKTSIF